MGKLSAWLTSQDRMGHSVGLKIKGKESIGSPAGGACSFVVATIVFLYSVLVYYSVLFHRVFVTEVAPDFVQWEEMAINGEFEPLEFSTTTDITYGIKLFDYSGTLNTTQLQDYFRIQYHFVNNNNVEITPIEFSEDSEESESETESIQAVPCSEIFSTVEIMEVKQDDYYYCPDISELELYSSPIGVSQNFVIAIDYCTNIAPDDSSCQTVDAANDIISNIGVNGIVLNQFFSPDLYDESGSLVAGFDQSLTTRLRKGFTTEMAYKVSKTENLFYPSAWFDFSVQETVFVDHVETFSMISTGIYQSIQGNTTLSSQPVEPLHFVKLMQSQENMEIKWIRRSYEEVTAMVGGTTAAVWFICASFCKKSQDTAFKQTVLSQLYTTDTHEDNQIEIDDDLEADEKEDPSGRREMMKTLDNREKVYETLLDQKLAMLPCAKPCKTCIDPKRFSNNRTMEVAMEKFEEELDLFEMVKLNRKSQFLIDLYMKESQQRLVNDFARYYVSRDMTESDEEEEEEELELANALPEHLDVKRVLEGFDKSNSKVDALIFEKVHEGVKKLNRDSEISRDNTMVDTDYQAV